MPVRSAYGRTIDDQFRILLPKEIFDDWGGSILFLWYSQDADLVRLAGEKSLENVLAPYGINLRDISALASWHQITCPPPPRSRFTIPAQLRGAFNPGQYIHLLKMEWYLTLQEKPSPPDEIDIDRFLLEVIGAVPVSIRKTS